MNMRQRQLHEHFAMIRSRFLRSAFFVCTLIDFRNFSSLLRNFNLFSSLFASELVAFNLFARHAMNQYWMSSFWWRSCSLWQSANIFIRCVVVYTELSDSQCRLLVFFSWRFLSSFLSRALARVRLSENFIYIHSKFVSAKRKNITNNSFSSSSSRSSNQQIQIQRQRLNGIVGHLNVFFLHFWLNQFCFFVFLFCFSHHRSSFDCSFWMHMHFLMHNKPEKELRLMWANEWASVSVCVWSSMCMLIFTRSEGNVYRDDEQ